jgi:acetyltransferase-like isoleucine patch superfamily enzyme
MSTKYLNFLLLSLPNFLWPVKRYFIKNSLKQTGTNFHFGVNSRFDEPQLIEVGNNVFMGMDTVINTIVPVKIGNDVMFGPGVTIMGGDHNTSEVGKKMREVKTGGKNVPVIIENDVWIGANVTILKGVKIGEGTVVGACSLVTESLPPYSVCFGNPCKPVKLRFKEHDLKAHLDLVHASYSFQEVIDQFSQFRH